jgi:3-oxoacyl-[acyl-carrier-protein] synthase II
MDTDPLRVVVTGLGAITPLGQDVASTWSALLAGKSGVRQLAESWAAELPVRIAAIADADFSTIPALQSRRMDRCERLALISARQAWQDAGAPHVEPERLGVSVATGIGGLGTTVAAHDMLPGSASNWARRRGSMRPSARAHRALKRSATASR